LSSDATVAYLSVSGNIQGLSYVGGVAGYSEGQIENIYVDAYLKGNAYVGGITGSNLGILTYGYFKGNIEAETGSYIGGISGFNQGSISEFYVNAMLRSEERRVGKECRSRGWRNYWREKSVGDVKLNE